MNRHLHLVAGLPARPTILTAHGSAVTSIGNLLSLHSGGAIEPWEEDGGMIRGLRLRIASEVPPGETLENGLENPTAGEWLVVSCWQDRLDSWTDGLRTESANVEILLYDPLTGEYSGLQLFWKGNEVELYFESVIDCRLIHSDMGTIRTWDRVDLPPLEEEALDRSNLVDSVEVA